MFIHIAIVVIGEGEAEHHAQQKKKKDSYHGLDGRDFDSVSRDEILQAPADRGALEAGAKFEATAAWA
jgi:hypothetical protein